MHRHFVFSFWMIYDQLAAYIQEISQSGYRVRFDEGHVMAAWGTASLNSKYTCLSSPWC